MENNGKINSYNGLGTLNNLNLNGTAPTQATASLAMYTQPELIDAIVTPSSVELVYKRQLMMSFGYSGMPNPEIYKVIYSRHDGSEKTIFGTFIPATKESFDFE